MVQDYVRTPLFENNKDSYHDTDGPKLPTLLRILAFQKPVLWRERDLIKKIIKYPLFIDIELTFKVYTAFIESQKSLRLGENFRIEKCAGN